MTAKHLNRAELADPPRSLPANLGSLASHRLRGLLPQTSDLVAHLKAREEIGKQFIVQIGRNDFNGWPSRGIKSRR